jgi:predicted signal transduction protein with EAL and GGDEF domain
VYNPADAKSLEQLLTEADVKMYEQKKSKNLQNKG